MEKSEQQAAEAVELKPGTPFCSTAELNRIARQQGLCLAIAQASVLDQICQVVSLEQELEHLLIRDYLEDQGVETDEQLSRYLERRSWSQEDLRYFATKGQRLTHFKQKVFREELEVKFLERKLDFDKVEYSLIRVSDENLAFELHQRLLEGESSFNQLASQYSEGDERFNEGRIGPIPLTAAHREVAELLRTCQPGELCTPLFLVNIWLIIRLDKRIGAQLDDDLSQQILSELFNNWLNTRVDELLSGRPATPLPLHMLHD